MNHGKDKRSNRPVINIIFFAEDKNYNIQLTDDLTYPNFITLVSEEINKYYHPVKAFIKKQDTS
jgi:hypothetical protein